MIARNNLKKNGKNPVEKSKNPFGKVKSSFTAFTDEIFSNYFLESYQGKCFRLDAYSGLMIRD